MLRGREMSIRLSRDGCQLLSQLERISRLHAHPYVTADEPAVFADSSVRELSGQWPYTVNQAWLPMNNGKPDTSALPAVIERHYEATVLHYTNGKPHEVHNYFLPPALSDDPYLRHLFL